MERGSRIGLKLESGRTHQIRVHMTYIGCPLIGDKMYRITPDDAAQRERYDQLDARMPRQALHASELSLEHPVTGERLTFYAPLPDDMAEMQELLRAQYLSE